MEIHVWKYIHLTSLRLKKKFTCVSTNPQFSKIFLQQQFSQGKCILKIHLPTSTDQTYFPWLIKILFRWPDFLVCLMLFNATFNNISVTCISWRSVLLVEETGGPGENHRPVASHWQTLSHNVVHLALVEIRTYNISGDRDLFQYQSCCVQLMFDYNLCSMIKTFDHLVHIWAQKKHLVHIWA